MMDLKLLLEPGKASRAITSIVREFEVIARDARGPVAQTFDQDAFHINAMLVSDDWANHVATVTQRLQHDTAVALDMASNPSLMEAATSTAHHVRMGYRELEYTQRFHQVAAKFQETASRASLEGLAALEPHLPPLSRDVLKQLAQRIREEAGSKADALKWLLEREGDRAVEPVAAAAAPTGTGAVAEQVARLSKSPGRSALGELPDPATFASRTSSHPGAADQVRADLSRMQNRAAGGAAARSPELPAPAVPEDPSASQLFRLGAPKPGPASDEAATNQVWAMINGHVNPNAPRRLNPLAEAQEQLGQIRSSPSYKPPTRAVAGAAPTPHRTVAAQPGTPDPYGWGQRGARTNGADAVAPEIEVASRPERTSRGFEV